MCKVSPAYMGKVGPEILSKEEYMYLNTRKSEFNACKQQSHRSGCTSVQSDQGLYYSYIAEYDI